MAVAVLDHYLDHRVILYVSSTEIWTGDIDGYSVCV